MTQKDLADAVGVTPAAVYQWEDVDGTTPSVPNLEKIVAALGITMGRFYKDPPKARGDAA